MLVRVKKTGSGTYEDPIRPALSQPVTWMLVRDEGDTMIIRINKKDYEKISSDVIEVIAE